MPPELESHDFHEWPYRDQTGRRLFVRAAMGQTAHLVAYSDYDGPTGWRCAVYGSQADFWSGTARQVFGPYPFPEDLIRELTVRRLI